MSSEESSRTCRRSTSGVDGFGNGEGSGTDPGQDGHTQKAGSHAGTSHNGVSVTDPGSRSRPRGNPPAQSRSRFGIEIESGPFWQSRNDVQIPNDETRTRFSLKDLVGGGPWASVRFHLTWNLNDRHALRAVLAPLSVTETGSLTEPVSFAGGQFDTDQTVDGTYRFNSWRLGYRYRVAKGDNLNIWAGLTAKIRDAEVRLEQGAITAKDTDLGFVPLVHLAADWRFAPRAHLEFDFDGLAGGPGQSLRFSAEGHVRTARPSEARRWVSNAGRRRRRRFGVQLCVAPLRNRLCRSGPLTTDLAPFVFASSRLRLSELLAKRLGVPPGVTFLPFGIQLG